MKLERVELENFRCFPSISMNLAHHTLIIGPNDVGKTNLLDAMRLLLDPHVSQAQLEPSDEDFCVYTGSNRLEIWLFFSDVTEKCLTSTFGKAMGDSSGFCLGYVGTRTEPGGEKTYQLFWGKNRESAEELPGRNYLRFLNLKWIGANRDISQLLRRERKNVLEEAREQRSETERIADDLRLNKVRKGLHVVTKRVKSVSFVGKVEDRVNAELSKLSRPRMSSTVEFTFQAPTGADLLNTLELTSRVNNQPVVLGGDGRKNQVFVSLWTTANQTEDGEEPQEVSIFFFEEPEAHLHPHQQRRLADYVGQMKAQTIISTHSPQIAVEFVPGSIIRLFNNGDGTQVAGMGVNADLADAVEELEFRLNLLPAETYFADCVFLVEGVSEVLFYRALAADLGISLDHLNVSILSVEGVGFERYTTLYGRLGIPWVLRTDNDFILAPRNDTYYGAGVRRSISAWFADPLRHNTRKPKAPGENEEYFTRLFQSMVGLNRADVPSRRTEVQAAGGPLESVGLFLAQFDLEIDLYNSCPDIQESLDRHFGTAGGEATIPAMKEQKGTFMYQWLKANRGVLAALRTHSLAKPLLACQAITSR